MFEAVTTEYRAPFDGTLRLSAASTAPADPDLARNEKRLDKHVSRIADAQRVLYAHDSYSVLLVFQAMDAAGKDSTIRAVLSGVNPAGCQVFSFKKPTSRELDHDFLWRTTMRLPERGRIGVFNRSQYEEVLVVRVHPEILGYQRLPFQSNMATIWNERLQSIRDQELHLARNGVVILKFFLNVSRDEQRKRFLARLENPDKRWKFSAKDVAEAEFWPQYMEAYEDALNETSRPWAPWYVIPADDKPYMRYRVAKTISKSLRSLNASYPQPADHEQAEHENLRNQLNMRI